MKVRIKILILCSVLTQAVSAEDSISTINNIDFARNTKIEKDVLTAAISTVSDKDIAHRTTINPANSLYGLFAGLQVMQKQGTSWDDAPTMYIRGMGTLNNKAPLILVDGFERTFENIAIQEIESISILKDAVSLSMYGLRGANGVILISTKRGNRNIAPIIDLTYEFKMGTPIRLPKFADAYTYANALNEGLSNDGLPIRYRDSDLEAFKNNSNPEAYPNVDWIEKAYREHTYGDNVNFSIRGGSSVVRYFTSVNFLDDRGLFEPTELNVGYSTQNKYSKLNVRTNLDIDATSSTLVKINFLGNFSEKNCSDASQSDIFKALYTVPSAAFPIKTVNQTWGGTTTYSNNPIALIAGSGYARYQQRTIYADLSIRQNFSSIIKGLSAGVSIGYDDCSVYKDYNEKAFAYEQVFYDKSNDLTTYKSLRNESPLKFGSSVYSSYRHFNFNADINFSRTFNKHNVDAMLFYAMDNTSIKGKKANLAIIDAVGRVHYDYDKRYLIDVALSTSGSSILEPGKRFGLFPSLGLGWVLSKEPFLKNKDIDLLKMRLSYGIVGGADYDNSLYLNSISSGNNYYFQENIISSSGLAEQRLKIANLTYEKSHKSNFGFDLGLFSKLNMSVDAFFDHRTDILVSGDGRVSSILGINAPKVNDGVVNNYGVELSANFHDAIGDFRYSVGGLFSFVRNEIINQNEKYQPYDYLYSTGQSINQLFGYEVIGVFQSQEEIDNRAVKQYLSEVRPGDLIYKDQNGDNRIDSYDKITIGYNTLCPEIYYGINLSLEYKNFGIYANFQGVSNYSKVLNTPGIYRPLVNNGTISTEYYNNHWTKETPDAKYPRLTTQGSDNNYTNNSLWIVDGSFFKLRTLELYYNFPSKFLNKNKIFKGGKVFAQGHDLFSIDTIGLSDPESVGVNYPTLMQLSLGINVKF